MLTYVVWGGQSNSDSNIRRRVKGEQRQEVVLFLPTFGEGDNRAFGIWIVRPWMAFRLTSRERPVSDCLLAATAS